MTMKREVLNTLAMHDDIWLNEIYNKFIKNKKHNMCFFELNIKDFQFYNIRYGKKRANEILEITYQTLEKFIGKRGYLSHGTADSFHFFIECPYPIGEDEDPDDYIMNAFMLKMADELFEMNDSIIFKNFYVSMGVIMPEDIKGCLDELIEHAEFFRKRCPELKNRSFCYDVMCQEKYDDFVKKGELARKLTTYRFQEKFEVFIQPKINLENEKIIGGEVLLRLFDEGKEIPLSEYLPLLNQSREIYMVDLMIFKKACKYLYDGILNKEIRVPLSFNITNANLDKEGFINDYQEIMDAFNIPKNLIEFEFLEEISQNRSQIMIKLINQFSSEGFSCSLDDFGTGSSTYEILLNANLSTIKLDRMFFNQPLDSIRKSVLKNTCDIIHHLGIKVLAEGVEDEEYINYLKEIGCDFVQGFYYYKPMPINEFQALLNEQNKLG